MTKFEWFVAVLWVLASAFYIYARSFAPELGEVALIPCLIAALLYCLAEMAREIRNSKEWK